MTLVMKDRWSESRDAEEDRVRFMKSKVGMRTTTRSSSETASLRKKIRSNTL